MMQKTNAGAIRDLVIANLFDMVDADTLDLSAIYCTGESGFCNDTSPTACRECIKAWLSAPFTGSFTVRDGRFVGEEAAE